MALIYARDLLKISLSEICDQIGFDRTSTMTMEILIDVCEREFRRLFHQIHQIQSQSTFNEKIEFDELFFFFQQNSQFDLNQFEEFLHQFSHLKFPHPIYSFPAKKSNQFVLKIPSNDSEDFLQRQSNPSTEFIYPWLPLFPHQTSEQIPSNSTTTNLQSNVEQQNSSEEQQIQQQKKEIHHPLNLLTLTDLNSTDEEFSSSQRIPIGKKPTRSLPMVLYRPKRLIEIETQQLAAEKAKKDSFEKENNEKDSSGNSSSSNPAPLRVTIPKQSIHNEKTSITIKKFPTNSNISPTITSSSTSQINSSIITPSTPSTSTTTTSTTTTTNSIASSPMISSTTLTSSISTSSIEGIPSKKSISSSTKNLSIHLSKKSSSSPLKNFDKSNEISSPIPPISHSTTIESTRNESFALDLSKKSISSTSNSTISPPIPPPSTSTSTSIPTTSAKVPTFKLNIKKMSNPSSTTSENSNVDKTQRISSTIKSNSNVSNDSQKANLSIRTSSFPTVEKKSIDSSLISPPTMNLNEKDSSMMTTQPKIFAQRISSTDQIDKGKKKKKKSFDSIDETKQIEKKMKKDSLISNSIQYDLPPSTSSMTMTTEPEKPSNPSGNGIAGGIKLKIKLGKPTTNSTEKSQDDLSTNNSNPNRNKIDSDSSLPKPASIKLTLPRPPPPPSLPPSLPLPSSSSTTTTIDHSTSIPSTSSTTTTTTKSSNRRKSSTVKRIIPLELSSANDEKKRIVDDEDLANSLDDLPLGERRSPTKHFIPSNIEIKPSLDPICSTPVKKKTTNVKRKSNTNTKKSHQHFGLAIIEERRIHHDSQEKIWICPSCNRPDNGQEAMIACDLCDDWYHWECVGINEAPDESTKWFCPKCHRSNSSTSTKTKKSKNSIFIQQT